MKYGVIGYGVVGGAIVAGFKKNGHEVAIYDKFKTGYQSLTGILSTEVVFVAVPTPPGGAGYDLYNVKAVLGMLCAKEYLGVVVLVSTLNPGDYKILQRYIKEWGGRLHLVVSPEFLTEKNAEADFYYGDFVIYGPHLSKRIDDVVEEALGACRNTTPNITRMPADMCYLIKTHTNLALAMKLASANLIYLEARRNGLSKENAQKAVDVVYSDPRLESSQSYHTVGNLEKTMGFGGMCLPKDLAAKAAKFGNADDPTGEFLFSLMMFNNYLRKCSTDTVGKGPLV